MCHARLWTKIKSADPDLPGQQHISIEMAFIPEERVPGSPPAFEDLSGDVWTQMCRHECTFGPDIFFDKMMNLIKNPNINSSWLFRADIVYDDHDVAQIGQSDSDSTPRVTELQDIPRQRIMVRTLVPRSTRRDAPLNQTCTFHRLTSEDMSRSLVIYVPHVSSANDVPFYHPKVRGVAHYHEWDTSTSTGFVSIHYLPFPDDTLQDTKVQRTAYHLLQTLHKHGQGAVEGYVKRVHHDIVVPQARFQDRYSELKSKYASSLIQNWGESTDPLKHVFEDLGIAAFLIELWEDMYKSSPFQGFVDIGCGNGLLVYILNQEGYAGWGFDARSRTSWNNYACSSDKSPSGTSLEQRLLLPSIIPSSSSTTDADISSSDTHDGIFPPGTFIISNHADELTPWTPLLATYSNCPFIMIPCCSHNLTGAKWRAPPPKDKSKGHSTYASLVEWVTQIAEDCGWEVETEMLRIPSTRNTGLLGRKRRKEVEDVDVAEILSRYGGAEGFRATVAQLLKGGLRGH